MTLIDRILGRKTDLESTRTERATAATPDDARAVAEYERLLRTAPANTIEKVHVEAFEKLTPEQLDVLFERFTANAPTPDERPTDTRPSSLARTATRVEVCEPGTLNRLFGADLTGIGLSTWVGISTLETIAGYAIASALWSSFDTGVVDTGADDTAGTDANANANSDSGEITGANELFPGFDDSSSGFSDFGF